MIIIRYDIIRHIDFIKRRINPFSQQLVCIRVGILGLEGKDYGAYQMYRVWKRSQ